MPRSSRVRAGYKLLRFTQAEICGGSLLAAWKFSSEHTAVSAYLPALADACATTDLSLKRCTNELVRYYQVCFPEAAKTYEGVSGLTFPESETLEIDEIHDPEDEPESPHDAPHPEVSQISRVFTPVPQAEAGVVPSPKGRDVDSPTDILHNFGAGESGASESFKSKKRTDRDEEEE